MKLTEKVKELSKRNLKEKYYDYLILDINSFSEFKEILDFIVKNSLETDFIFLLNRQLKNKKLFIQVSDDLNKKDSVKNRLKEIHNYFRIKYNRNLSFKKSSKHSVFFEGKNFLLNSEKLSQNIMKLSDFVKMDFYGFIVVFGDELNNLYLMKVEDEYKYS